MARFFVLSHCTQKRIFCARRDITHTLRINMTTKQQDATPKMNIDAYRENLSYGEMTLYLSQYPDKAWDVVVNCPEHRVLALGVRGHTLRAISKSEQTLEEIAAALSNNGLAIEYASKRILKRNPELYMLAVKSNGLALRYVPDEFRYDGIYLDAVLSNASAIRLIPKEALTRDIILTAVKSDGLLLQYVPKKQITKTIARSAFASNRQALQFIPSRFCDSNMAIAAVTSNGSLLQYVPARLIDADVANAAIENNGQALRYVPQSVLTEEMCRTAVRIDPESLEHIPPKFLNEDLECAAIRSDWKTIRFIYKPSESIKKVAFEQSALALQYFSTDEITPEICDEACSRDPEAIRFVPNEFVTVAMLRRWLSTFFNESHEQVRSLTRREQNKFMSLDQKLLCDSTVASYMRQLGIRKTLNAHWIKKSHWFFIREAIYIELSGFQPDAISAEKAHFVVKSRISNLDGLIDFFDGDLSEIDFKGYPFDDFDPKKHDLSSAHLSIRTLKRLGAYDESAYIRLVALHSSISPLQNPDSDESIAPTTKESIAPITSARLERSFYYVSDIHLDYKLRKTFRRGATKLQIKTYIDSFVNQMVETSPDNDRDDTLLVLGDTTYNIEVARLFFQSLRRAWRGDIVCILGNHELWHLAAFEPTNREPPTISAIVEEYRGMLSSLGIWLLQNEVLVFNKIMVPCNIGEQHLHDMNDAELVETLRHSSYVILGGLGFTGACDTFNADHGIYRDVVSGRKEDAALSSKFSALHDRLGRLAPNAKIIVATHTPMSNWSQSDYQPGWIYLNGHTHRNMSIESNGIRVYADNQIGYRRQTARLARFYMDTHYDPFRHYPDGIHEVSRMDYLDFNSAKHILIYSSFTCKGKIIMIKRESVYLFLFLRQDNSRLYLLSGARQTRLKIQDPRHYYERMYFYTKLVRDAFNSYMVTISAIAEEVKAFGGNGRVHGCIVDIDFLNHIYLDPFTGNLIYYYATSINDRYEYPSLRDLLENHQPSLLPAFKTLLKDHERGAEPIVVRGVDSSTLEILHRSDTLMYRTSNVVRSIQYLFDSNVIRVWNEELFNQVDVEGDIKTIVNTPYYRLASIQ